jgi:hypothetical protein
VEVRVNNDHHIILINPLAAHGNTVKDNVFLPQQILYLFLWKIKVQCTGLLREDEPFAVRCFGLYLHNEDQVSYVTLQR